MRRFTPILFAFAACFLARSAEAQCSRPARPCVCDFAGATAVDMRVAEQADGGLAWEILDQRGPPVVDAGLLVAELPPPTRGQDERIFGVENDRPLGAASFTRASETYLCDFDSFRGLDSPVVLDAMTSSNCLAAMADAGVPEPRPTGCDDTSGPFCGCTSASSFTFVAAGIVSVLRFRRRRVS